MTEGKQSIYLAFLTSSRDKSHFQNFRVRALLALLSDATLLTQIYKKNALVILIHKGPQIKNSARNVWYMYFSNSINESRKHLINKGNSCLGNLKRFKTNVAMPKYIILQETGTYMALKTRPIILRLHASKKKEYLEGIYSELLLYLPWREESELQEGKEKECVDLFNANFTKIEANKPKND